MAKMGPGKSHRKGLTFIQIMDLFPTDKAAEQWFMARRWPDGPFCPHCGSFDVQVGIKHKTMTHRCRDCDGRPMFSLKTGTIMEGTKLGYRIWAIAFYLLATNLKSVSSMKLHRDLGVTQKTAWHLAHRIRKSWEAHASSRFDGPVEVDETYIGGRRENMPRAKRKTLKGRGPVGKTVVAGAKDRATNKVSAAVVDTPDKRTMHRFIAERAAPNAKVYTDDYVVYRGMPFDHEAVRHSTGEYVRGEAHTQGIESFWSVLKRAHKGTFHHLSKKHMGRYIGEFSGRHDLREADTIDQLAAMADGMIGKRLRYQDLTA